MLADERRNDLGRRLAEIASEAGVVLNRFRVPECRSETKPDGSPVSEADIASEAVILARLDAEFPDWSIISEESADISKRDTTSSFFLVDPLDGTKAFLAGAPDFCVLIALIAGGVPIASAIHAPATGQSWWAGTIAKASDTTDFRTIRALRAMPQRSGGQIAIVSSLHAGESSRALCRNLDLSEVRCENSALKFARLADGEADVYPRIGRTMQWDIAAGDALLRATGGGVFDLDGAPLRYGPGAMGWANPDFVAFRVLPEALSPQGTISRLTCGQ